MLVRIATAFQFNKTGLKRPLLACNCGSQTQLSKFVWGQMPTPTPPHFVYPFLLLAVTSVRLISDVGWTWSDSDRLLRWTCCLLSSCWSIASSKWAKRKRENCYLICWGHGKKNEKRGEQKPFNLQGEQWEKRGLGLFGCSSGDPHRSEGLWLQEQMLPLRQHATPQVWHFLSLGGGWLWN